MAEVRALVDDQAFDLMEHRRMGLVAVAAIRPPRNDDADGRWLGEHRSDLHRRRVRAQQKARAVRLGIEVERVVHGAGGMALGKIELAEIVVVGLDVGPLGDRESHVREDRDQFLGDLAHRMDASDLGGRRTHRQRDVDRLGVEPCLESRIPQLRLARRDCRIHPLLETIDERASLPAFIGCHCAERLEQGGDRAVLPHCADAKGFDRSLVRGCGDLAEQRFFKELDVGHSPSFPRCQFPRCQASRPGANWQGVPPQLLRHAGNRSVTPRLRPLPSRQSPRTQRAHGLQDRTGSCGLPPLRPCRGRR